MGALPARRGPSPNVVALLVLVALGVALLAWQRPWSSGDADADAPVALPADARNLLELQLRELSEAGDEPAFVRAAGEGERARTFGRHAWAARERLGVTQVELRYVDGGDVPDRADGSTLATVQVSWTAGEGSPVAGPAVRDATVRVRLDPRDDGFDVRRVEGGDDPVPLWLAGDVRVGGSGDVRVVAVDGGVPDLDALDLARTARSTVVRTVPDVSGPLTIVSPRTQATAAALLGREPADVERIAGVTTTVDGTTRGARVVVLNPDLFASMDRRAAQVVLSHEATHALTGAVGSSTEPWVAEGFADWVALRDDDAPLAVSAGQALARVRADGPPAALPSAEDFATAEHGLGAVYESAWLVFRMLEEDAGPDAVLAFHRAVQAGTPVDEALRDAFDLGTAQVTARWQAYLEKSASTVS